MSNKALTYVWENAPYESTRLLVLLAIADFADDDGECYPGVTRLAKKARLSPRALQKHLAILEQDGWLKRQLNKGIETGRGKTNRYTILPMFSAMGEHRDIPRNSRNVRKDIPTGVLWDIPTGESASSPKPSAEPSAEPSVKDIAPAAPDAQATPYLDKSVVKEKSEVPATPEAPSKERKVAPKERKPRTEAQQRADAEAKRKVAVLGAAYGVAVVAETDEILYLKIYHQLINGGVPEAEFTDYVTRIRRIAKQQKWTVTIASLTGKGRITEYVAARDAYRAQQSPAVVGGMQVDPEKLKQLGWN